jgi:hypothetical protein
MRWLHAPLLAVALAAAACTDPAVVGTTNAVKKDKDNGACAQTCSEGEHCNPDAGKCVACLTDADCGADAGLQCDPDSFECVQCLARSDCDDQLTCVEGACAACTNDAECGDAGQCDDGKCQSDDHGDDNVGESGDHSGGDGSGGSGSSGKD